MRESMSERSERDETCTCISCSECQWVFIIVSEANSKPSRKEREAVWSRISLGMRARRIYA